MKNCHQNNVNLKKGYKFDVDRWLKILLLSITGVWLNKKRLDFFNEFQKEKKL